MNLLKDAFPQLTKTSVAPLYVIVYSLAAFQIGMLFFFLSVNVNDGNYLFSEVPLPDHINAIFHAKVSFTEFRFVVMAITFLCLSLMCAFISERIRSSLMEQKFRFMQELALSGITKKQIKELVTLYDEKVLTFKERLDFGRKRYKIIKELSELNTLLEAPKTEQCVAKQIVPDSAHKEPFVSEMNDNSYEAELDTTVQTNIATTVENLTSNDTIIKPNQEREDGSNAKPDQ